MFAAQEKSAAATEVAERFKALREVLVQRDPAGLTPERPVAPIDFTKNITAPIIGIFGNEDKRPSPDQVNRHEQILKDLGISSIRLLTSAKLTYVGLGGFGIEILSTETDG